VARAAVDEILYMLDEAFDPLSPPNPDDCQSLMPNLARVTEDMWRAAPAGGERSIFGIVIHIGACKYLGANHMFGDRSLTWDSKLANPWPDSEPHKGEVIAWLRAGHRRFRHHVEALEDGDLGADRMTQGGQAYPTRWLLSASIQHDLYHAGEINHIRSLLAGDDRWAHERELAAR
jgi:DinB superfamily